jgi:hypothetical protein
VAAAVRQQVEPQPMATAWSSATRTSRVLVTTMSGSTPDPQNAEHA